MHRAHSPLPEPSAAGELPAIGPHHSAPRQGAQHAHAAHKAQLWLLSHRSAEARDALADGRDEAAAAASAALANRRVDRELPAALLEEVALLGAPEGAAS